MELTIVDENKLYSGWNVEGFEPTPGWGCIAYIENADIVPRVGDSIDWPPNDGMSHGNISWRPGHGPIIKSVTWIVGGENNSELKALVIVGAGRLQNAEA